MAELVIAMGPRKRLSKEIVDKMPPPGKLGKRAEDKPEAEDEGGEMDAGLVSAAAEVRAALKGSDDEALAQALKDFLAVCGSDEE